MRSVLKCSVPSLLAALLLAACGSSSSSETTTTSAAAPTPAASVALVKSAASPTLHATVLTTAQGMTLYSLSGEHAGKFICTSTACVKVWHPLLAAGTATPTGTVASLGTVKRPDGTEQVTYKGMPLYTFTADTKAGEAHGEGIKDVGTWEAVSVGTGTTSGASQSESSAAASPPTEAEPETSSSKGGYSY